jgi:hypothetical protein
MRTIATLAAATLLAGVAGAQEDVPPRKKAALRAWLEAGAYRAGYTPEPAVHPSTVHPPSVRTWYGPILVDDLRAGRPVFSKGAAMVKELQSGGAVVGWAAMRKLKRKSGPTGKGWLFYEATGGSTFFGRGHQACAGRHRQGTDYLRSEFRP